MTQESTAADSQTARRAMIDSQLRPSGINQPWLLAAIAGLAREDFVPEAFRAAAYIDRAVPLGEGRFLAPPIVHARMLAEAAPTAQDTALLIGDAGGYLAALVSPLVAALDTVSPADAATGVATGSYSLVLVDGAAERLPEGVTARLAENGRIVTGLVERGVTRLARGRRIAGQVALLPLAELGIPVLSEFAAPKVWSF